MDSIAIAYWKRPSIAFTVDYGQKSAEGEIRAAKRVSELLEMDHHVIDVDCSSFGSGNLSNNSPLSIAPVPEWWPYRNQLIITLACMKGISLGISELMVGSVKTDELHRDGSEKFYSKISDLTEYQEGGIRITSPAIHMDTIELIKISKIPLSMLYWAHSCHTSSQPCMNCGGCRKYLYVLQGLGIEQ